MSEVTFENALREKVRLNISIIGCGNAGSQLADAAFNAGFTNVYCVNTSEKDLDNRVVNPKISCFMAGTDGRGAGMNREAAKAFFSVNYKDLFEKADFKALCDASDIIIVGCSCSGGTGSGIAPVIVKALKTLYPGKIVIFYGIFPRLSASPQELGNSMDCIRDIEDLRKSFPDGLPYMLADLDYFSGQPNEVAYPGVINKMVSDIEAISGKFLNYSPLQMIDENDTRVVIGEPGYMSIYRVDGITQKMLDSASAQELIVKQIHHSPALAISRDGLVEKMAIITNMPEDMEDPSKAGDYSVITNYVGTPTSTYSNYAVIPGGTGQMIVILSGQSYPIGHMAQIDDIVAKYAETYKRKSEARKTYNPDMVATYDVLRSSSTSSEKLLHKPKDLTESERKAALDGLFGE